MKKLILGGLAIIILSLAFFYQLSSKDSSMGSSSSAKFVFFDVHSPESFDPLNADQAVNINMMRMLYLTPLEISVENKLVSTILNDFAYDTNSMKVTFNVKPGLRYSDGSEITSRDVLLSILRMASVRPNFPVLRDIEGINEWLKSASPLKSTPSGVSLVNNKIEMQLSKQQNAPLFRFTLELFSIVPEKCIDLDSGRMTCDRAPFSGFYEIETFAPQQIVFKKRVQYAPLNYKSKIIFTYVNKDLASIEKELTDKEAILFGSDISLKEESLSSIEKSLHIEWLPASRFRVLLINPTIDPFSSKQCRQTFIKIYRDVAKELLKNDFILSSSIFTPIVPGYLAEEEFSDFSSKCSEEMRNADFPWHVSDKSTPDMYDRILLETMNRINPNSKPQKIQASKRELLLQEDKSAFANGGSGFWAADPIGDLQMLFTPNLHAPLKYTIKDTMLSKKLKELDPFSTILTDDLKEINKTIYDEALINVVFHSRKFFASRSTGVLVKLPQAVSSPAFYQVVR